jgi:hypothetical protein
VAASEFVKRRLCLPKRARSAILHTRFATQGLPEFNENNHPIVSGPFVGVHNGVIYNDHDIWKAVGHDKRNAVVDSEAIWALMAFGNMTYLEALAHIEGPAALAWMRADDEPNVVHIARASSNPLVVGITEQDSIIFASTQSAVVDAVKACPKMELAKLFDLQEGMYLGLRDGQTEATATFEPAKSYYGYSSSRSMRTYEYQDYDDWSSTMKRFSTPKDDGPEPRRLSIEDRKNMTLAPPVRRTSGASLPSLAPALVNTDRVFGATTELRMKPVEYHAKYDRREAAIQSFYDDKETCNTVKAQHELMFLRPGDHVSTFLMGVEVEAEVVALPQVWPGGLYTLRAWASMTGDVEDGYEAVLVQREENEFEVLALRDDTDADDDTNVTIIGGTQEVN